MVNLTTIAQGRKPLLIYGVKRGKVPSKLRPHMVPQRPVGREGSCMNEMYRLMLCWKNNAYNDSHCKKEIRSFLYCVSKEMGTGKSKPAWTLDEINATIKRNTPNLKGNRKATHEYESYAGKKIE